MATSKLNPAKVVIDDCKIIEVSVAANMKPQENEAGSYELQVNYGAKPVKKENGSVFLDLSVEVASNGAPTYDIRLVTRTKFVFPEGTEDRWIEAYLREEGTVRAFDFARTYIKSITSFGVWDSLEIPNIALS